MAGTSDTPDGTPAGPDDINSRLAEIAAELASEARFKEPSAAERARARVAAAGPAAKQVRRRIGRRRAQRKAEEPRRPLESAGVPAPPRQPRQSRWARRAASRAVADRGYADATMPSVLRSVITVVIIVALLVGVSIGLRYVFRHFGAPAAPGQAASQTPTTRASTSAPPFTTSDPFANSQARALHDNAEGIVPPVPAQAGSFTVAQVSSAYATVRQLLIASNLTPVLTGATPTAFASLLTREQRTAFDQAMANPTAAQPKNALARWSWVTVFAPGTELVGTVIKVNGVPMTATASRYKGRTVLQVAANDLFVYPVQQLSDQASRVRVVVHVFATVLFAHWDSRSGPLQPWIASMATYDANVHCGSLDGHVHPQFADLEPGTITPGGAQINPYSLTTTPPASCYQVPRA